MRRSPWTLALLFGSALLILVSLFLPWQEASSATSAGAFSSSANPTASLPDLFASPYGHIDGRSSVGDVSSLSALLLALAAGAALVWPRLRARVPLATPLLLLSYFTVAVAAQTHLDARGRDRQLRLEGLGDGHFHIAYGAYVGLAAVAVALVGAGLDGREALSFRPGVRRLCVAALGSGVLVALLLSWQRVGVPASARSDVLGVRVPAGIVAAALALRLLVVAWRKATAQTPELVVLAVGTLLFVGAALTLGVDGVHLTSAWVGLALAILSALVVLGDRSALRTIKAPTLYAGAVGIAGAALLSSFFLPWQTACYGQTTELKTVGLAGSCASDNGFGIVGSPAALIAIALVLAVVAAGSRRRPFSELELTVALVVLVATLGFLGEVGGGNGVRVSLGYGSIVSFAATGLLVILVLARQTWSRPIRGGLTTSLAPIVLGAGYVVVVVLPWWNVLPDALWSTFVPSYARVSWLTVASALLAIRLVHLWFRQALGGDHAPELIALSIGLVGLAILDSVRLPSGQLTWNSGVLLGLSVPLTLLAVIEERGGLGSFVLPEILRIDRI